MRELGVAGEPPEKGVGIEEEAHDALPPLRLEVGVVMPRSFRAEVSAVGTPRSAKLEVKEVVFRDACGVPPGAQARTGRRDLSIP